MPYNRLSETGRVFFTSLISWEGTGSLKSNLKPSGMNTQSYNKSYNMLYVILGTHTPPEFHP